MQEVTRSQSKGTFGLVILAVTGGVAGLLAGLWLLVASLGHAAVAPWIITLVALGVSSAELAFAYGLWTQTPWALKPTSRAVGFAVAIGLILLGLVVVMSSPVTVTGAPA